MTPFELGRNSCWASRGSQLPRALAFISSLCCTLNNRSRAAHSFFKIGRLFSLFLFSCPSLALLRLLILLLLMSGNVHPNSGPIFLCSVCAGNVTWLGKLHLLQMGPSKVLTTFPIQIQSSWQLSLLELPPCRNNVTPSSDFYDMYTSTVQSDPPLLMMHSRPILVSKPIIPICPFYISFLCLLTTVPCSCLSFYASCLLFPPDSLRVLQWNAGGLRATSTELLHFLSFHAVVLICIQESNLYSSSSFRIPGFSALRSNCIHS